MDSKTIPNTHFLTWLATKPNLALCHAIMDTILVNLYVVSTLVEQLRALSCVRVKHVYVNCIQSLVLSPGSEMGKTDNS